MSSAELRELRRQKILNNMNNRMMKIAAVSSATKETSQNIESNPEFLNYAASDESDGTPNWFPEADHHQGEEPTEKFPSRLDSSEVIPEIKEWVPSQRQPDTSLPIQKPAWQRFMEHNYLHTVLVALCAYIFLKFNYGYYIFESAMVPFWTHTLADCAVRKRDNNRGMMGMLIAAMTMFGMSNQALSYLADIFILLSRILRSLIIYIFFLAFFATVFGT